jgi:hypothetical protein
VRWVYTGACVWMHPSNRRTWPAVHAAHDRGQYIARMRMWKGCRKQGGRLGMGPRKDMHMHMHMHRV